jgi:hypothetical protein
MSTNRTSPILESQGFKVRDVRSANYLPNVHSRDPFRPVQIQDLDSRGQSFSHRVAVAFLDDEHTETTSGLAGQESGTTLHYPEEWKPIAVVSPDYQLIPNAQAAEIVENVLRACPQPFQRHSALWNGNRLKAHWIGQHPCYEMANLDGNPQPHYLGVRMTNSYDGSGQLTLEVFTFNIACANQFTPRNEIDTIQIRHVGGNGGLSIPEVLSYLDHSFSQSIRQLQALPALAQITLTGDLLTQVYDHVQIPDCYWGPVLKQLGTRENLTGGEVTMYSLFQALTNVATHVVPGFSSLDVSKKVGAFFSHHYLLPAASAN